MSERKTIQLVMEHGEEVSASLLLSEFVNSNDDDQFVVRVDFDRASYESKADTYFEALRDVRRKLETLPALIACNGAVRCVYPSPLLLNMGDGRKAYKLTMGRSALSEDLVDIFEAPVDGDIDLATVEEQERFYSEWIASL